MLIIAVDFDGTIVTHEYPGLGAPVPGALEKLRLWQSQGHQLILNTMRGGKELLDAVDYLEKNGVTLWGVNENPTQSRWTSSPKVYAHVYVDDAAYGCPLIKDPAYTRPYVDWSKIELGGVG